jgi:hypothetical protein
LLIPLWAAPAGAAPDKIKPEGGSALAQVPAGSPIVVSLHGFKRTTDRLIKMVTNAMPDLGPKLQTQMEDALKQDFFEGRKLKGLKDDGHIFLVYPSMPRLQEDTPNAAVILRVTDYKTFRDSFLKEDERKALKVDNKAGYEVATIDDKKYYFIDRKDYAVVTPDEKVAQRFTGTPKWKGLDTTLAKPVSDKVLEPDIAVYVDLAAVNKEYADKIKAVRKDLDTALERFEGAFDLDKNTLGMIKVLVNGALQVFDDSQNALLAIDFRPEGLAVHAQLNVRADTKSNTFLKKLKPTALAGLKTLPSSFTNYMAAEFGKDAVKPLEPILKGLMASSGDEDDKDQAKAIKEAVDELMAAGPLGVDGASKVGSGIDALQVWHYADPAKAAAGQFKLFKALKAGSKYQFLPLKEKPVIKADAEKFMGAKLTYVSMKWDLDKLAENLPGGGGDVADIFKKLTGEGADVWFGVVERKYVQVTAKDWKTAEQHLTAYFAKKNLIGEDKNKGFARARGHLPRAATAVSMVHVPSLAEFYAQYMYGILKNIGGGIDVKEPGKASKKPSYIASALTLKDGQGSFDLWLPGDAAKEFRRVFEPMFKQDDN